jgi:hypothetical protein
MEYRVWHSGRESVSYEEQQFRCDFMCTHAHDGQPQCLHLSDQCIEDGAERKLTHEELVRVEERLLKYLSNRTLFGLKIGTQEVQVVRRQTLKT